MKFVATTLGVAVVVVALCATATAGKTVLPSQCRIAGKVLCISKADNKLRLVQNGLVRMVLEVRFGDARGSGFRTAEGSFSVFRKVRLDWSRAYQAPMPFSMYFFRGQAIHYSYSFAREGYRGASHGCVNVRNMDRLEWLYDQVPVRTPVYIYS